MTQLEIVREKLTPNCWTCPACGALNSSAIGDCIGWPGRTHAPVTHSPETPSLTHWGSL
jgi:hypothetical protein